MVGRACAVFVHESLTSRVVLFKPSVKSQVPKITTRDPSPTVRVRSQTSLNGPCLLDYLILSYVYQWFCTLALPLILDNY